MNETASMLQEYTSVDPFLKQQEKVKIIHCYNTDLNLAWTIEYVKASQRPSHTFDILDMSQWNVCNETIIRFYLWNKFRMKIHSRSRYLTSRMKTLGIFVIHPKRMTFDALSHSIRTFGKIYFRWSPNTTEQLSLSSALVRSVHSSLSNRFGTLHYRPLFHPIAVGRRILAFYYSYFVTRQFLLREKTESGVVIPNGRLPVSAGAALAARELGLPVRYLERGGSPGMLDVFSISPHSMEERREAVTRIWDIGQSIFPELSQQISADYFHLRRKLDPYSGVSWQKDSSPDRTLGHLQKHSGKQVWCYFTSTELEFAVHEEPGSTNYFENQTLAVQELVSLIGHDEVVLVIRRHPQKKWRLLDKERYLWRSLRRNPKVIWIGPKDSINSYQLGMEADVVFHYNSSIGAELIFLGHRRVLTLGPTSWLPPKLSLGGQLDFQAISATETATHLEHAVKWAFYQVMAGSIFTEVEWFNGRGKFRRVSETT